MHHYRIILHHDLMHTRNRNVIGIPFDLNQGPTYRSFIIFNDRIVGEEEKQRALKFYRIIHTQGTVTAITVSPDYDRPLPKTEVNPDLVFFINDLPYKWEHTASGLHLKKL